ncbi:hypothetical protein SAMN05428959_104427 [Duganella sp. CF517]|uniref:hypothetical protein n=1 Tax=Duganella sp. CF517 TaxID=1881038 RepID=UPI0008AC22B5|nr:hypothetical protein [Duganella sp. CF517]SEO05818.1 hypothetical protein SAMN05428959_104427 [Duganella sp. CF517]
MNISDHVARLRALLRIAAEVARLPPARLRFDTALNPELVRHTHRLFTRPHPRYRLVRNKSIGIALIDLRAYASGAAYLHALRRRDYAGYHSRRARERGYTVVEIDRNDYIDDIHGINTSAGERQGRPMDPAYAARTERYPSDGLCHYGVLDKEGRLVAYGDVGVYGDFAATDRLLGYKNNDGVMYLLLADIACRLIDDGRLNYLMYDTYLGALPGLRNFKKKLGFQPYRIRYSIC